MSCVIVGTVEKVRKLGFPEETAIVPPETFHQSLRNMTHAVVVGPRLLHDRDFELLNRVPVAIVLTNATDVLHLAMHMRAGRLCLTPCDAIVIDERLVERRFFAPWIDLLPLRPGDLADFIDRGTGAPCHSVPAGFETLPKSALTHLAAQMRALKLTQHNLVVGSSPACRSLIGTMCNLANSILAEIESLPPDAICAEPDAVADQLAAHPDCQILICPVLIDDQTPPEAVHQTITTATRLPVNLVRVIQGYRLSPGRVLSCLTYQIG